MGRPPVSESSKRSKVRSVRLTAREVAALERRFGSVGKGLRALVDAELARGFRSTNTVPGGPPLRSPDPYGLN